ncbi:MAG TPA: hypothetical protein VMV74_02350 [Bacteroidales bacterium]|nr:hypothetical protein [Bacteroidales bacterium]
MALSIELAPVEAAILTDFIVTGLVLKAFENLTLRLSPPNETRTTCLNELLVKPGEGVILRGSTSWGAELQVPAHTFAGADFD